MGISTKQFAQLCRNAGLDPIGEVLKMGGEAPKSGNKFNARKQEVDGHVFDSRREADRYMELRNLERAMQIHFLKLQVPFLLQPRFRGPDGKVRRQIVYIVDFTYWERQECDGDTLWCHVVEDVKGFRTAAYQIKRKLFEAKYPEYQFREVK